jgi:hypothetical protein
MLRNGCVFVRISGIGVFISLLFVLASCSWLGGQGDQWDPRDDTKDGATVLIEPDSMSSETHGPHTLTSSDRADWFRVWLSELSVYAFGSCDGQGATSAALYREVDGAVELVASGSSRSDGTFAVTVGIDESGWYYLRVSAGTSGGFASYDLEYSVVGRATPDAWDPMDDLPSESTSLSEPTEHGPHTLSSYDDVDWFRILLRDAVDYVVSTNLVFGDTVLTAYDASLEVVGQDDDGGPGYASRLVIHADSPGWYYVAVQPYRGVSTMYTLAWTQLDDAAAGPADGDPWDPADDTLSSSTYLSTPLDVASSHGPHVLSADDEDWFRVYLRRGTRYRFEAASSTGDPDALLYRISADGSKNLVDYDFDSGTGMGFRIYYTAGETGWYYILAYPYNRIRSGYTLEYQVVD